MRADFQRSDATLVRLTTAAHEALWDSLRISPDRQTEIINNFQATAVAAVTRGGRSSAFTFHWFVAVASLTAGFDWLVAMEAALDSNGDFLLTLPDAVQFRLNDAQVKLRDVNMFDDCVEFDVEISGGNWERIGSTPTTALFGTAEITGQNKTVTVLVTGLHANGIVRCNVAGATTSLVPTPVVTCGEGGFEIAAVRKPELEVNDGLKYVFTWDVVSLGSAV
jgi:hypothetical protein